MVFKLKLHVHLANKFPKRKTLPQKVHEMMIREANSLKYD